MSSSPSPRFALAAALLLSACSFANDTLWPTLAGEDPRGAPAAAATSAAPAAAPLATAPPGQPATREAAGTGLGAASEAAAPGAPAQLRRDLDRLKNNVAQHTGELLSLRHQLDELTNTVDGLADGIDQRLKAKAAPNDPQLLGDFHEAQAQLNRASILVDRLNNVSSWATTDAVLASYVTQAIRAARDEPTISDPERRQLAALQREADRASASVDQLVTGASGEIASRNLFIAAAHRRLAALGPEIAAGHAVRTAAAERPAARPASAAAGERRALVTIRFDRPDVPYQQELYSAVSEALGRRPDLAFDIVAVSPPGATGNAAAAERNVESVVKSLTEMGLPADRFRLSAATMADATGNEIRIYPR
ncbi:MAG TPA: hypothetical protein VFA50_02155 [Stellaceae bacterium]|nr:hypothetical protein [Stellaceae bacterium]